MKRLATTEIIIRSEEKIILRGAEVQMLAPAIAAEIFGISQREIFRLIESGTLHFIERQPGAAMICLPSLVDFFELFAVAIEIKESAF
jgi:hypothetical protein